VYVADFDAGAEAQNDGYILNSGEGSTFSLAECMFKKSSKKNANPLNTCFRGDVQKYP